MTVHLKRLLKISSCGFHMNGILISLLYILQKKVKTNFGKFVNPYVHRSNGGIPIFSQERIQERAKKKEELQQNNVQETERKDFLVKYAEEEPQNSAPVLAVTDDTELNFITAQRRVAYYMFAANKNHPNWATTNVQTRSKPPVGPPKNLVELDSFKFDYLTGDGYGFTIRIPGRNPQRARAHEVLERARQPPLQTFEEARSKPRKKQVYPAYAIDLNNEHVTFPDVTPSFTSHHGRYYGNDSEEEFDGRRPAKNIQLRRGLASSFDSDLLDHKRRNFARSRSRSEHGMLVKSEDNEDFKSQSAGHRPRNDRPMFEPSAPIPSYSQVSSPLQSQKITNILGSCPEATTTEIIYPEPAFPLTSGREMTAG
ncbi:hypothetical protein OS493_032064 [Desmophyllum pertusum]|uniref:Uncharacterized protein n=1 Tax=Desmophyllum pertusum TaxID=174260 RepID=A0A9X0CQH4_9CNID|nr:hypothetical protein OS493_032064 [Desmophyllum pertusum]